MLLESLLRVVNGSNFLGIHEPKAELERVCKKYGKREVKEIDTSIDEGQLIYIELER